MLERNKNHLNDSMNKQKAQRKSDDKREKIDKPITKH